MLDINETAEDYIPLRDIVFQKLREAIVTGQMQPGERLMEIKLSNMMGVSRTPVREAIRKLQAEGLVIMNARRGAIVAPINKKDLKEILEIRKALERLTCQLVSAKADEEAVAELKEINQVMEEAVEADDIQKMTEQDVAFHEKITELADNAHLTNMLDQIKAHLYRYRLEFIKELRDRSVLTIEHNRIIEAIEAGNARAAAREIEKHIELQEKYILNTLEQLE